MTINNMLSMLQMLRSNPMQILGQLGIPQNMANNPQAVIQNMLNSGRISQDQYNQAMQMARTMGVRF